MVKNKFFDNLKTKIKELSTKNKKTFFISVVLLVAFIFLIITIAFSGSGKKSETSKTTNQISVSEYASNIEKKLVDIISKLESVKDVSVFVMVDSTPKIEYLTEKSEEISGDSANKNSVVSESVVFEKNGSISTPVVVTTIMPKVTGVLIVTNQINNSTKLSIISSVSTVLNIDKSCISLLQEG